MSFQRSCIYHPDLPMRVIEESQEELYKQLKATGLWFDSPKEAKDYGQIRRESRQGSIDCEHSPQANGSGTQRKRRIRKESTSGTSAASGESASSESGSNAI